MQLSRHLLPALPQRLQRFEAADSWRNAATRMRGYEDVSIPLRPTSGVVAGAEPTTNELILMEGIARVHRHLGGPQHLRVVDIGGSRGDARAAAAAALPAVRLDWTVVELPAHVRQLQTEGRSDVTYTADLDMALRQRADVTLASALLNYVPHPHELIAILAERSSTSLLLRLPLWPIPRDRIAIQHLSRTDRGRGYPCWFFSDSEFRHVGVARAELLMDVASPDDRAYFAGHYGSYRALAVAW